MLQRVVSAVGGGGGDGAVMIAQNSRWYFSTTASAQENICNRDVNSAYVTRNNNKLTFVKAAKIVVYVYVAKYPSVTVNLNNVSKGTISSGVSDDASQLMVNLDVAVGDVLEIAPSNVSYGGENIIGCVVMAVG